MRVGHVAHVHERAPHPAAAVQQQPALDQRVLDEGVDHEVEAHPRAVAVDGAVAQDHRAQALVLERRAAPARRSASRWSRRRAAAPRRSRRAFRAAARRRASRRRRRRRARTPRSTQALPSASVATAFICQLASGSYSAVGSFERPARWITPSTPSRAVAGMSRTSATTSSMRSRTRSSGFSPQ